MALNKSMHPRNRYKDRPPDFAYLASKYPDFQQHVHTSLTGRPVYVPDTVVCVCLSVLLLTVGHEVTTITQSTKGDIVKLKKHILREISTSAQLPELAPAMRGAVAADLRGSESENQVPTLSGVTLSHMLYRSGDSPC